MLRTQRFNQLKLIKEAENNNSPISSGKSRIPGLQDLQRSSKNWQNCTNLCKFSPQISSSNGECDAEDCQIKFAKFSSFATLSLKSANFVNVDQMETRFISSEMSLINVRVNSH